MNLIKKIYDIEYESLFSDKPAINIDREDAVKYASIIKEMHTFDVDLYYSEVIKRIQEIFGLLDIGSNYSICLNNIKANGSRFIGTTGSVSFNYQLNGVKNENTDGDVITYYSLDELESSAWPILKISSEGTSLYYSLANDGNYLYKYEFELSDGVVFSRQISESGVLFRFEGVDNIFIIEIKGYSYLFNELKLVEYLRNLSVPYDMFEIYSKLCEISLSEDLSIYPEIALVENKKEPNGCKYIVNLLSIVDGKINNIVRTVGDKTICCDADGNWDYTMSDENVVLTINSRDTVRYSIEAKNTKMMDDYTDTLLRYDVTTARNEVEETRRLVRERTGLKR